MAKTTACLNCNTSWLEVDPVIIKVSGERGLIAWCDECHDYLSIDRKKQLVSQVISEWIGRAPARRAEYEHLRTLAIRTLTQ